MMNEGRTLAPPGPAATCPGRKLLATLGAVLVLACVGRASAGDDKISPADVEVSVPVYEVDATLDREHEHWNYSFSWSGIPVGEVYVESRLEREGPEAPVFVDVQIKGRTNDFLDFFWRYRLQSTGRIRVDPFSPDSFHSLEQDNSKKKETTIRFAEDRTVDARRRKGDKETHYNFAAPNTHTIFSTIFIALELDHRIGNHYEFDVLTGASRYLITVDVAARETVMALGVPTDAWRLSVHTKALTDPEDDEKHTDTDLWVSAAKPRRLLHARSGTYVGAIYVDLVGIEHPGASPAIEQR